MATGQTIADEVRTQLNDNDSGNRRWADAELLGYINAACRQIVFELPEANAVETLVSLTAGARQSLPTGGVKFLGAWNYDSVLAVRGPAITPVELDALTSFSPEWSYPGHLNANLNYPSYQEEHSLFMVEHVAHDPREPTVFYIFPPSTAATDTDAVLLDQSGVTNSVMHQDAQTVTVTYALPDGTDNRMLTVFMQATTGTLAKDLADLVVTYGGVPMNALTNTYASESLDGNDIGQAMYALSVDGQTFANDDLVISGVAWDGTFSTQVFDIDVLLQTWDNIDPAFADFSYSTDVVEALTTTIALDLDAAEAGNLVVTFVTAGIFLTLPIAGDLELTLPAAAEGFTYSGAANAFTDSKMASRVAYSTTHEEDPVALEWTHGLHGLWDGVVGWGAIGAVFPNIAGGSTSQLYVRYSFIPTALTALANTFALRDEFINATVDYVTYRALTKDGRLSQDRRMQLWNNFLMALGKKPVVEQRVDTREGRAGGDGNG